MDTILGIVDGYREVHGEPPNVGRWTAPGVKRIGETEEPEPEPEPTPDPDPDDENTEEIPMKKTWEYLIPKFRLPVVIDFKAFFEQANVWDKILFWIASVPVAAVVLGFLWLIVKIL